MSLSRKICSADVAVFLDPYCTAPRQKQKNPTKHQSTSRTNRESCSVCVEKKRLCEKAVMRADVITQRQMLT